MTTTTLRNATLGELATVLTEQAGQRYDVVATGSNLEFRGGNLIVRATTEEVIDETGVTPARDVEICLTPTEIFDGGIADRLGIPLRYLKRMRDGDKAALLDHNVNEWLHEAPNKQWLVRGFKGDGADCGIARAFLSDRFGCIDNLDVVLAALKGVQDAGVDARIVGADLSERRMSVRVVVPEVTAMAPLLLADYRSPFGTGSALSADRAAMYAEFGQAPNGEPIVFAGFVIGNSETGGTAFTITPRITVLACFNGMTFTADQMRKVHLGSQMDAGEITWSDETNKRQIALITSQATDAVATFCNSDYVERKLAEIEGQASAEVTRPVDVVKQVGKELAFTDLEVEGILGHFIQGGQMTAGGVLNAVTSFAQTVADPDRATVIEDSGIDALAATTKILVAA